MSQNTQPIYTKTPLTGMVLLTNQTAGRDPGSANLPLLVEGSASGALIECIRVVFLGNEADPFEVRLYRKKADQTSAQLFAVLPINTVVDLGDKTSGEVTWANLATAKFSADFELPPILMGTDKTALRLEPYENLYLGVSSALTNGVNVFAIGGQYE